MIRNLPISFIKNQIAIERFKSNVREMEIIKNFFLMPDLFASLPATEIDSSFIKEMI